MTSTTSIARARAIECVCVCERDERADDVRARDARRSERETRVVDAYPRDYFTQANVSERNDGELGKNSFASAVVAVARAMAFGKPMGDGGEKGERARARERATCVDVECDGEFDERGVRAGIKKVKMRVYVASVSFACDGDGATAKATTVCACSRVARLDWLMDVVRMMYHEWFARDGAHLRSLASIVEGLVNDVRVDDERCGLVTIGGGVTALEPRRRSERRGGNDEALKRSKSVLFRALSARDVVRAVCAIASERRVLLKSASEETLTACAEALRSLLRPLNWQHVYVPCVPGSMIARIEALPLSTPYIIGLTPEVTIDSKLTRGVVTIHLDEKTIAIEGGEMIHTPPDELFDDVVLKLVKVVGAIKIGNGERPMMSGSDFTRDVDDEISHVFSAFWNDFLKLSTLHRFVMREDSDTETVGTLKVNEYMMASNYKRCSLISRILDTSAFAALLEDADSLRRPKSGENKESSRGKFRSMQLAPMLNVAPAFRCDTTIYDMVAPLTPRISLENAVDGELVRHSSAPGEVMAMASEVRRLESFGSLSISSTSSLREHARDSEAFERARSLSEVHRSDLGDADTRSPPSSPKTKRASWSWIKDKIKRKTSSESLPSDRLIAKALKPPESLETFDWCYDTMTKKEAAKLSAFVLKHRENFSRIEDSSEQEVVIEHTNNQIDDIDGVMALVYPIFAATDNSVAAAMAQHAANRDYVALIDGVVRQLRSGVARLSAASFALRAAVTHADSAGDVKSIAHALLITRTYQPTSVQKLWLDGAARWDNMMLWRCLLSYNSEHEWLKGSDVKSYKTDIVCCFALVGLSAAQATSALNVLNEDIVALAISQKTPGQANKDAELMTHVDTYASISFESWIETLRRTAAPEYGVSESSYHRAKVPDCCPSGVVETELAGRSAITALATQLGALSSLVAIGGGGGEIAFWAPDSDSVTYAQTLTDTSPVTALTFVPRSTSVFVGHQSGSVEKWDSTTGVCTFAVPDAHEGLRVSFASTVVNQVISSAPLTATAGNDGTVKLWDARAKPHNRASNVLRGHKGGVTAFATRDARGGAVGSILTGDVAGIVRAWDPRHANAGPVAQAQAHSGRVTAVAPLHRSDMTASAGKDCVVRVLRLDGDRGGDISLCGHGSEITSLAVIQDDSRGREPFGVIASGSRDGGVCIWSGGEVVNDVREPWRCVSSVRAHVGAVTCIATESGVAKRSNVLAFNKKSEASQDVAKYVLTASVDHSVACWKLATLSASWLPATMNAPAAERNVEATCSVIEASRYRLFTGDCYGRLRAVALPEVRE